MSIYYAILLDVNKRIKLPTPNGSGFSAEDFKYTDQCKHYI